MKISVFGLGYVGCVSAACLARDGHTVFRESPVVLLVEALVGKGYQVSIYDEKVELTRLTGANKSFLEGELPHIASLMRPSLEEVVAHSEVVVIGNSSAAFREVHDLLREDQILIDLVGITGDTRRLSKLPARQESTPHETVS